MEVGHNDLILEIDLSGPQTRFKHYVIWGTCRTHFCCMPNPYSLPRELPDHLLGGDAKSRRRQGTNLGPFWIYARFL